MAARSRGNGTNFHWLRKSCDISTCVLIPDGNPEKYRRPMKSAISRHEAQYLFSHTPDWDPSFFACEIMISRIPIQACGKDKKGAAARWQHAGRTSIRYVIVMFK